MATASGKPRRKSRNRGRRPSKFTTPTLVVIAASLRAGRSLDESARPAGIGPASLFRWMAKARGGEPRFGPLEEIFRQARESGQDWTAFDQLSLALCKAGS